MITIVIRKRGEAFEAFLQDDVSASGRGTTSDSAVGDLVRTHCDRFNIAVVAAREAPTRQGLIRT